jgi:hypothetical protein
MIRDAIVRAIIELRITKMKVVLKNIGWLQGMCICRATLQGETPEGYQKQLVGEGIETVTLR